MFHQCSTRKSVWNVKQLEQNVAQLCFNCNSKNDVPHDLILNVTQSDFYYDSKMMFHQIVLKTMLHNSTYYRLVINNLATHKVVTFAVIKTNVPPILHSEIGWNYKQNSKVSTSANLLRTNTPLFAIMFISNNRTNCHQTTENCKWNHKRC